MKSSTLLKNLKKNQIDFFTGVPDSLLRNFTDYLSDNVSKTKHKIASNEGLAVSLATGYYLATKKLPLVYMQNSGLGNSINPLVSMLDSKIYSIPLILLIGWRGEPSIKDEPQHIKQGMITREQLDILDIKYLLLNKATKYHSIEGLINHAKERRETVALLCSKNTFAPYKTKFSNQNKYPLSREQAIKIIIGKVKKNMAVVSTTGMISRELNENKKINQNTFYCVGGMGHASVISKGIAQHSKSKKIICLDGDGALLMHLGALPMIGEDCPKNFVHILLNNGVHGSVGNQKTMGFNIDFCKIALASGYDDALLVDNKKDLEEKIEINFKRKKCIFIEVRININVRNNLGRPKSSPTENKNKFIELLSKK